MKRLRILGVALLAMFALAAIASSSAFAMLNVEAVLLSGSTFPVKFEGKAGAGKLETLGGKVIECSGTTFKGELTDSRKDTVTFDFTGCKALGFSCNTTGDAAGTLLVKGTSLLVWDSLSPLLPAILVTPEETKIECTALAKLVVKGNLLILFPSLTSGTEVTSTGVVLTQSKGEPTDKVYWENTTKENEASKEALLLASFNGGAFESSGIETKEAEIKYATMVGLTF